MDKEGRRTCKSLSATDVSTNSTTEGRHSCRQADPRQATRASLFQSLFLRTAAYVLALCFFFAAGRTQAASATWNLNPANNNWLIFLNWTPNTVPGSGDTATFGLSNVTNIVFSSDVRVNSIVFAPGASAYAITANPQLALRISGTGITNNSGITQNFVTNGGTMSEANEGGISFSGDSSAGNGTFTVNGGTVSGARGGGLGFGDDATASSGTVIVHGGIEGGKGAKCASAAVLTAAQREFRFLTTAL